MLTSRYIMGLDFDHHVNIETHLIMLVFISILIKRLTR